MCTPATGITDTKFTVTKLLEKHEYQFRVCAINKVGVGEHADVPGKILLEEKLEAPDLDLDAEMRKMISIRAASTLRLFVPVRGRPAPEVKWGKAEGEIKETAQIDNTGTYASLVIENVDRFDSGKYTLTAENASGVKSVFISVRVLDSPSPPANFMVKEITKNSVTLTWEPPLLDGGSKIKHYIVEKRESTRKVYSPAIIVTRHSVKLRWTAPEYDGGSLVTGYVVEKRDLPEGRWMKASFTNILEHEFTVIGLTEDCKYDFRVIARNAAGAVSKPSESTGSITAKDEVEPPKCETDARYNQTIVINAGETFILEASVEGKPIPTIQWFKGDVEVENSARAEIKNTDFKALLVVKDAIRVDGGQYTLVLTNVAGSKTVPFSVKVLDRPGPSEGPLTVSNVTEEKCSLSWLPPRHDGGDGDLPGKVQIENGADYTQLSIEICDRNDAGKYILKLENSAGTKSAFVSVRVLDTPGAPLNLTVKDIKRESVTLTWEPPLIDGGARIKNYLVEKRESTRKAYSSVDNKCTKTSYRITGLTEGTIYYFRVLAENEFGVGLPAETEDSVKTSEPPLPVGKVTLTEVTKTSVSLSWEKPDHDGGSRIMGYNIEMQPQGSEEWVVATTTKTCEGTVLGLSTGHEYLFRVSAFNEKGKSDPRPLAAPVTTKDVTIEPRVLPLSLLPLLLSIHSVCLLHQEHHLFLL
uniref:Titin n=1 Tax=Myripristis murdjan TaxID=586833 RepID=A0A667X8F2_9TELE